MDPVLVIFCLVAFMVAAASFFHGVFTIISMEDDAGLSPKIVASLDFAAFLMGLLLIMSLANA